MTRRSLLFAPALAAAAGAAVEKPRISLALWSFSGSFFQGKWKLMDMPGIMRNKLGIEGLEHVNQFFETPFLVYLQKFKRACSDNGIRNLVIMCDEEGSTAAVDKAERKASEIAHRKWIDIAHYLGCHSVRCNMYGGAEDWKRDPDLVDRAAETFRGLVEYANGSGLNIIVENHGRASSDPDLLVSLVKKVESPKFGLLVDFGNWNRGDDRYANVRKTIRYARAVSVKGTWGPNVDPAYDMEKLLNIAMEANYPGWWAIEQTPARQAQGAQKLSADEQFELEVKTVRDVKAVIERVVV